MDYLEKIVNLSCKVSSYKSRVSFAIAHLLVNDFSKGEIIEFLLDTIDNDISLINIFLDELGFKLQEVETTEKVITLVNEDILI